MGINIKKLIDKAISLSREMEITTEGIIFSKTKEEIMFELISNNSDEEYKPKVGDKLICYNNKGIESCVTVGKTYDVIDSHVLEFHIVNDLEKKEFWSFSKNSRWYWGTHFKLVPQEEETEYIPDVGDKLFCYNNKGIESCVTVGKVYKIDGFNNDIIEIINDKDAPQNFALLKESGFYWEKYFTLLLLEETEYKPKKGDKLICYNNIDPRYGTDYSQLITIDEIYEVDKIEHEEGIFYIVEDSGEDGYWTFDDEDNEFYWKKYFKVKGEN